MTSYETSKVCPGECPLAVEEKNTVTYEVSIDSYESFTCCFDQRVYRRMCEIGAGPHHHGCCGGGCGVCKMQILSGDYEVVSRMSRAHVSKEEEVQGYVLLCCVEPRSNLKIGYKK